MAQRLLQMFLMLAVIVPASHSFGHFPAVYGRDYELLQRESPWRKPEPGAQRKPLALLDDAELEPFLDALENAELDHGAYGAGLPEPLSVLALLYRDAGRYEEADALYRRALHVERVNGGLYSGSQEALVEAMLAMYREQGNLEKLDWARDYHFRLLGSGQPPFTAKRAGAALDYLYWQREAIARDLDDNPAGRLVHLYEVNRRMLTALGQQDEVDPVLRHELVMSQLRNLYLILGEEYAGNTGLPAAGASGPASRFGTSEAAHQRLLRLQDRGAGLGRELLQGYLDDAPGMDPGQRMALRMQLADWLQWNERYHGARDAYRAIIADLLAEGDEARYREWFSEPVELPAGDMYLPNVYTPQGRPPVEVTARYRVSATGDVSGVEVSTDAEEHQGRAQRLARVLRESHFRPRYNTDGEREAAQVERSYRLYR